MKRNSTSSGRTLLACLLFLIGIVGAILTATVALVLWLGGWVGLINASLIVCLLYGALAVGCYYLSLRRIAKRISRQLQTVSYVADLIEHGYDWVLERCSMLLGSVQRLLDSFLHKANEQV